MERMDKRGLYYVYRRGPSEHPGATSLSGEKLMFSVLETSLQDIACWRWVVLFFSV